MHVASNSRAPLPAAFLSRLPDHPDVQELARLFEAGNYAQLRQRAAQVTSSDAEVHRAIAELYRRTQPAPLLLWLVLLSGVLLIAVTIFALGHT